MAARLAVEHLGLHREPSKIASKGVGRTAHQAETEICDLAVCSVAAAKVLLRARLQVVHAVALAILHECHDVAQSGIGLHVEQRGVGTRAAGEGWMGGLIADALLADVDDAAIADALE